MSNKRYFDHIQHPIEADLAYEAKRISEKFKGSDVVIILAGNEEAQVPRCMTASSMVFKSLRLRYLLGILQTSIQIETLKHFKIPPFNKRVEF